MSTSFMNNKSPSALATGGVYRTFHVTIRVENHDVENGLFLFLRRLDHILFFEAEKSFPHPFELFVVQFLLGDVDRCAGRMGGLTIARRPGGVAIILVELLLILDRPHRRVDLE